MSTVCADTAAFLLRQADALCRERGASLLFLTLFGSTLYGSALPGKSDLDVRGVFLPSQDSLLLAEAPHSLYSSTGKNNRKNTAHDVDIALYSMQRWLLQDLPGGDIGALDLLFAPTHAACTLYRHPVLDPVFAEPLRLFDTRHSRAYAAYCMKQAKKYGIWGSRAGALKRVSAWLRERSPDPEPHARLKDVLDALRASLPSLCPEGRFCSVETIDGERALRLCGKLHMESTRLQELMRRLEEDMRRYAAKALAAEKNQGVDFKALSHAVRALQQMEELLQTGGVIFPLRGRAELLAIKQGAFSWQELEPYLVKRLAAVDALRENSPFAGVHDPAFARARVLACYARPLPRDVREV